MSGPSNPEAPAVARDEAAEPGDFVLLSLDRCAGPDGSGGKNWVRYRIGQGTNVIDGYRRGDNDTVKAHLDALVCALNERRGVKRGRVTLTPPSRNRRPSRP